MSLLTQEGFVFPSTSARGQLQPHKGFTGQLRPGELLSFSRRPPYLREAGTDSCADGRVPGRRQLFVWHGTSAGLTALSPPWLTAPFLAMDSFVFLLSAQGKHITRLLCIISVDIAASLLTQRAE